MSMRERLATIAEWTQRIQLWLSVIALVVLMLVTVMDVFLRYVFNSPIRASYDSVESLLLVFVFNSMAATFFGRRNVVMDIIDGFIPRRAVSAFVRMADILSVVTLGLLLWAMIVPAMQSYDYAEIKQELGLPIYLLWVAAIASLGCTIFCTAVMTIAKPTTDNPPGHPE
jgi:TRAP-type C4-dicarboxylate transport system permease small subunit